MNASTHHFSVARQHLARAMAHADAGNNAAACRAINDGLAQVMAAMRPRDARRDATTTATARTIRMALYTLDFQVR